MESKVALHCNGRVAPRLFLDHMLLFVLVYQAPQPIDGLGQETTAKALFLNVLTDFMTMNMSFLSENFLSECGV